MVILWYLAKCFPPPWHIFRAFFLKKKKREELFDYVFSFAKMYPFLFVLVYPIAFMTLAPSCYFVKMSLKSNAVEYKGVSSAIDDIVKV